MGPSFYSATASEDIVLVELFGRICAGLEMALGSGFSIVQYVYVDISTTAAQMPALHRLLLVSLQYPEHLPRSAWEGTFMQHLPMDVEQVSSAQPAPNIAAHAHIRFLVGAGCPC